MGVSQNRGTPKWMVYNGKPFWNGWFLGKTPYFRFNIQIQKITSTYAAATEKTSQTSMFSMWKTDPSTAGLIHLGNQRSIRGKEIGCDEITTLNVRSQTNTCLEPQGQPFINGCFNWMIPNLYIEHGCFTKHPFIYGCLGFQAVILIKYVSSFSRSSQSVQTLNSPPSSLNILNYVIWKQRNTVLSSTASPPLHVFSDPSKTNHISKKTPTYPRSIPQESLNPQMKGIPS